MILKVFFLVLLAGVVDSARKSPKAPSKLQFGVIYNERFPSQLAVFKYIVSLINDSKNTLTKTKIDIVEVAHNPGINVLDDDVISKLKDTVSIFDLTVEKNHDTYILGEILKVPFITSSNFVDRRLYAYSLSLDPTYEKFNQALVDLLEGLDFKKNKKIALVFELSKSRHGSDLASALTLRNADIGFEMMPELDMNDMKKTETALTEILKSHLTDIVLLCESSDLITILNRALGVGIIGEQYRWIVTNMDMNENITWPALQGLLGLRASIVDVSVASSLLEVGGSVEPGVNSTNTLQVVYSTIYDSVWTIALTLHRMISKGEWSVKPPEKCLMRDLSQTQGRAIMQSIKETKFPGLTGNVKFDSAVNRNSSVSGMDIINMIDGQVKKVGTWMPPEDPSYLFGRTDFTDTILWSKEYMDDIRCLVKSRNLRFPIKRNKIRVVTVNEPPFVYFKKDDDGKKLTGNDRFSGFSIDILREVMQLIDHDFELYLSPDGGYGVKNDGVYTGMIGELMYKDAEVAVAAITITSERQLVIDFAKPFLDYSTSLIMRRPTGEDVNFFAFLLPFRDDLWLSTLCAMLVFTGLLYVTNYFTPYGCRAESIAETGEGGDEFSLPNSLWFSIASLLQQGGDSTPKAPSERVLTATFWFFILILISTYTANLAAFFTVSEEPDLIESLDDLVSSGMKYGVREGGSLYDFFRTSQVQTYVKMWGAMVADKSFTNSTGVGVALARKEGYAFMTDGPMLKYYNQREPCNTMVVSNLMEAKSMAFGLKFHSDLTEVISQAILELRETGKIEKYRLQWWDDQSECLPEDPNAASTESLMMHNMAGVFIVLLAGVVIAMMILVVEYKLSWCKSKIKRLRNRGQPMDSASVASSMRQMNPTTPGVYDTEVAWAKNPRIPDIYDSAPETRL